MSKPPKIHFNWEISFADLIKIIAALCAAVFFVINYYKDYAILTEKVKDHDKRLAQHDESIKKLSEVSIETTTILREMRKEKNNDK